MSSDCSSSFQMTSTATQSTGTENTNIDIANSTTQQPVQTKLVAFIGISLGFKVRGHYQYKCQKAGGLGGCEE